MTQAEQPDCSAIAQLLSPQNHSDEALDSPSATMQEKGKGKGKQPPVRGKGAALVPLRINQRHKSTQRTREKGPPKSELTPIWAAGRTSERLTSCKRTPPLLVHNCAVYTADGAQSFAQALACENQQVTFVGTEQQALELQRLHPDWHVIDGQGRCVIPGFNDAHMHVTSCLPEALRALSAVGLTSVADMSASHEGKVQKLRRLEADGQLSVRVTCYIGESCLRRGEFVPIAEQNSAFGMVRLGGLKVWTDGLVEEGTANELPRVGGLAVGPSVEQLRAQLELPLERRECAGTVPAVDLSRALDPTRTGMADSQGPPIQPLAPFLQRALTPSMPAVWCDMDVHWQALVEAASYRTEWNRRAVRLVSLGAADPHSILSRLRGSAALLQHICSFLPNVEEHFCVQKERGKHLPLLKLAAYARLMERVGLQLVGHACGDGAVRNFVNAVSLERSTAGHAPREWAGRHRVEHCELVDHADWARIGQFGIVAAMSPYHALEAYTDVGYRTWVGLCRYHLSYAMADIKRSGTHVAFSTDSGSGETVLYPCDPLLTLHAAVNRCRLCPDQTEPAFTMCDAVDAYTRESAFAECMDNVKGQLKVGMLADFVMLSSNIFHAHYDSLQLQHESIALTVCDGRIVYENL